MSKILIVEDDKFLRELIKRKVTSEGFEAIDAVDGEKGLQSARSYKPDLILLDLMLPGIDGFEVLKKIKQDESISSTPVIILSNLGQRDDIEKGLKIGAADYLVKAHFTPNEIIEKIREVLKNSVSK